MEDAAQAVRLRSELQGVERRVHELRTLVQQEQRKAERMRSTQRVLEENMSRLYEAAKGQLEERTQRLTAARLDRSVYAIGASGGAAVHRHSSEPEAERSQSQTL